MTYARYEWQAEVLVPILPLRPRGSCSPDLLRESIIDFQEARGFMQLISCLCSVLGHLPQYLTQIK